jgi:NAD-dependent DNA ligase
MMHFEHIQTPFSILTYTFKKPFDGAFVAHEDNSPPPVDLANMINDSWDGQILWLAHAQAQVLMAYADNWFQENLTDMKVVESWLPANCLIYQKTPHGMLFCDTQGEMGSTMDKMFESFSALHPDINLHEYFIADCHLADNLFFGRDSCVNAESFLTLLYQEGVLSENIFDTQLAEALAMIEDIDERSIVLTGTFSVSREEMQEALEDSGFSVAQSVTKNSWLWCGKKPGMAKVKKAQQMNLEISTIPDLMQWFLKMTNQPVVDINKYTSS